MASQKDKERKHHQSAAPASTGNTATQADGKPDEERDPDLYDPVGMAGKKAGIVEEHEQQHEQEGTDGNPGTTAVDR